MNTETRHIRHRGNRTTIALETLFWEQLETKAKSKRMDWQQWVEQQLSIKPENCNRASWLRVSILKG